jgi:uncharacterized protein
MSKRSLILAAASAALTLAALAVYEAVTYHAQQPPPSSVAVARTLGPFPVDPSWVRSGTPNFRGTETSRSPDGKTTTGLWACDGPSTFEWQFGADETVHLLEGRVEVDYRGSRFTLEPGDTATFHAGTRAVWHVPHHAKKVFVLNQPGPLVRAWRKAFAAA